MIGSHAVLRVRNGILNEGIQGDLVKDSEWKIFVLIACTAYGLK